MAERDSLWVNGIVDQEEARVGFGALWTPGTTAVKAKTGFRPGPGSSPGSVTASGTPDGNVHVAPFQAVLQTSRAATGGTYVMTLDATKDVNVLSTPADATNPRNDLIIAWQKDTFYGDGTSAMAITHVVGTPSGTPSDPSLASYPDSITLARVRVDAGATTITSGKITDLRPASLYTVAVGGILPVATQAVRDALSGVYDGFAIYRQDRDWVEIYDGSAWRVQGTPIVTSSADLSAITNPHNGLVASNTSNGILYRYNGSSFIPSTPYRDSVSVTSATASVTFSGIPSTMRFGNVRYTARGDSAAGDVLVMFMRVNADTGNNYYGHLHQVINATVSSSNTNAADKMTIGVTLGSTAGANAQGGGLIDINFGTASRKLTAIGRSEAYSTAANSYLQTAGLFYNAVGPHTSITFLPFAGNFAVGEFLLTCWE